MAFTRFHDDPARIAKKLQQQTDQGRWQLDVPGNGANPCFMLDPHIIPQKWGANLWTNGTDIHSSLLGIDRGLNRDCLDKDKYKRLPFNSSPMSFDTCDSFLTTEQSRAIMPAWTAKDLQQNHAYILPNDPQAHVELPFETFSTRILEKKYFKREYDCVPDNGQGYTVLTNTYDNRYRGDNNIGGQKTCGNDCNRL